MRRESLKAFFNQYDQRIQILVDEVLSVEQEYISYDLKANPKQVQEIKQKIKQFIDRMQNKDEA